jgi:uncharacterized protein YggE
MNSAYTRSAVAVLAWLSGAGPALHGQEPAKGEAARTIAVSATATAYVKPDVARVSFAVVTNVGVGAGVRDEHVAQVRKLKDALTALAIPDLETRVVPFSISTVTTGPRVILPNQQAPPPIQTKQVRTIFLLTVRDKDPDRLRDQVVKLADVAEEHNGISPGDDAQTGIRVPLRIGGTESETSAGPKIEWLAEDTGAARQKAIKQAIEEATENARAVAGDGKLQVVGVTITTPDQSLIAYPGRAELPILKTGLIPITVQVRVTFAF